MNTKYYYNYRRNEEELNEEIIFCSNNSEDSDHYGNIQRIFKATQKTLDVTEESEYAKDLFDHFSVFMAEEGEEFASLSNEEIEKNINPVNIVESAGAWDNIEFINYLYGNTTFFNRYDGIITTDGAIFFEVTKDNLVSCKNL